MPTSQKLPTTLSTPFVVVTLAVVVLVVLVLAWTLTPLAHVLEPGVVMAYRERIRALPFAPLVVIVAFVCGGFVATPSTLMIGATLLVFGAAYGAAYSMAGLLASATAIGLVTRHVARRSVDRWLAAHQGSRIETFSRRLERHGVVAIILMRMTPMPFTLQNMIAGASRIRLSQILIGTAIGVVPVIILLAGVTTQFDTWLAHPDLPALMALLASVVGVVVLLWMLKRWAVRRSAER